MFIHLHRHSEFSLLDGVGTAERYAERAAELGQSALAITDHGTLAGTLYHVQACERAGVKPILGMEAYFRQDIAADREAKNNQGFFHLVLLAKNEEGWRNLMRLSSTGFTEEYFYQKPCIDWRILRKYSKGLIATSSCVGGIIPQALVAENPKEATKLTKVFQDIFGEDFYLELQPHDFDAQIAVNMELCGMMQSLGVPVIATQDVHYPLEGWHTTQAVLMKTKIGVENDLTVPETCWLTTEEEVYEQFSEFHPSIPEEFIRQAINETASVADKVEHWQIDKSPKIPKATKSVLEAERIIREWCNEGLERIGKSDDPVYIERLEEELKVLKKLKVLDYFVIVGDMVRWAKDQGIRVGPGRGSAAGCLVNYLCRITAIDPIGYDLLFERFMNEYRTELPDIDLDFQDDRRDEVKDYLRQRWGEEHVVDIASFQSFGLRAAIKDIGRVMGVPYPEVHRATEAVPEKTFGMDLNDLEEQLREVRDLFAKYPELRVHAHRLQGQIKGLSRHAGAVIVTDRPAVDLIPMMQAKDGRTVTQWSERANGQLISPYGFLKIDCLSTDALRTQALAIQLIKERHGIDIDFEDPKQFPMVESPDYADQDVVKSFADGNLLGVFQFQKSSGIKNLLRDMQPDHLSQIIAANAMYRPGPMQLIDEYIARKNGKPWELVHESLEPYLGNTFGILVFQEQVMQVYKALGEGVDPGDSATFLKVVAKGIARDLMGRERVQKYYEKFEAGCIEKGIPKEAYDAIWNQILEMTTYAFNKSHSTGYAVQAYQDKWLKKRYTLEEYSSLLTTKANDAKRIPKIIKEAKLAGVTLLPPDINTSETGFTVDGNSIRFGLLAIKNVADAAIAVIKEGRPYESYEDFIERVPKQKANKKVKKALFESGAFDSFGGRSTWVLDEESNPVAGTVGDKEKADLEKATIGFALTRKSEIDSYKKLIAERTIPTNELAVGEVMVGGEVTGVRETTTKAGENMAFVDLQFEGNEYKLTVFPDSYARYAHMFVDGTALLAIGNYDPEWGSIVVRDMCSAAQLDEDLKKEKRNARRS